MKEALSTAEQAEVKTLAAAGWPPYRIGKKLGRSPHTISRFLKEPEVVTAVRDEKAELAELYRSKARAVVASISDTDISKASLQQKSISSGVLLDKSLLLAGELPSLNVTVLLDVARMIRRDERDEIPALPTLPTLHEGQP